MLGIYNGFCNYLHYGKWLGNMIFSRKCIMKYVEHNGIHNQRNWKCKVHYRTLIIL